MIDHLPDFHLERLFRFLLDHRLKHRVYFEYNTSEIISVEIVKTHILNMDIIDDLANIFNIKDVEYFENRIIFRGETWTERKRKEKNNDT